MLFRLAIALSAFSFSLSHAELTEEQRQLPIEAVPAGASKARIVLLAGTPSNKPGQHEYFAGCALMMKWLAAHPGAAPVLVAEGWPENEAVLDGAKAVVCYMDGGEKLSFLDPVRWARMKTLADGGCGLIVLHQAVDVPELVAAEFQSWFGAVWKKDIGCRGHWDVAFADVPSHPVNTGVKPFELLKDGWLYNLRFSQTGITPLLASAMPDKSRTTDDAKAHSGRSETVAWAFERPDGGRSFGFTGCDLHRNWLSDDQRKLVLNGILWAAKLEVPAGGFPSAMNEAELARNLDRKIFLAKKPAKPAAEK